MAFNNIHRVVRTFPTRKFKYKISAFINRFCDLDYYITKFFTDHPEEYILDPSETKPRILDKDLVKSTLTLSTGKDLFVIFGPWGGDNSLTNGFKDKLIEKGHACLQLEFPRGAMCSSPELTCKYLTKIGKQVRREIETLKKKYRFKKINLLSLSLGGSMMHLVASGNKKNVFNEMILVCASCKWGETLFEGVATQKLTRGFMERGESIRSVNKKLKDTDPANLLNIPKETNVIVHLGKYDTSMPFKYGKQLVKKMRKMGMDPTVYVHDQGHYLTILQYLDNPEDYLFR